MASITVSTLKNGLRLHRIPVAGTRSVTLLAAFDAGARTERPEENGMAHFLEHLVFKGGEKYPNYRDVNEAAENIGAVLNAYTSHDLVAFHITARAQSGLDAADLLTDFVARPKIDPDELDRERGVVVQEIARANDQPAVLAEHLIDEAVFGDHPLGRPVLGPAEHLFERFAPAPEPEPFEPAPPQHPRILVEERSSNQSHLRMSYRPSIDVSAPRERAALVIYATLLGGSMGSRLFDEIREQRGLAYSVSAYPHAYA